MQITIRICGNALDVSLDGKQTLPPEINDLLCPQLQYKYLKMLRGQQAYDYSGRRRPVAEELRLCYTHDKFGKLVCGVGFLTRIRNVLEKDGHEVIVEDINPPHPRKDRYKEDWDNVARNFSFRARQDEALVKIASNSRGVISAPTGWGKSFTFKAIGLLYPKANIIITTKRKDLIEASRLHLSRDLPNIGQIGGGMYKPGRITVVTADSLHKVDADNIDIVLGEEAHELAADTYSEALTRFKQARMFAFTATPTGRLDNADMRLESIFGSVIFSMTYQEAVALGLVVPIRVRWLDVTGDNPAKGMVDVPKRRWGLWRNEYRNQLIANAARAFGNDEQVLIMVTTFEHAVYLKQHLPEFTLCYAERNDDESFNRFQKNKLLPMNEPIMTPKRRQELRQSFEQNKLKKVIATDVWSTGVSFDELAVLIRADARGSEIMDSQIPGRVCRLSKEGIKEEGLIIDCLDQFESSFAGAARKRKKNYITKGWIQDLPRIGRLKQV